MAAIHLQIRLEKSSLAQSGKWEKFSGLGGSRAKWCSHELPEHGLQLGMDASSGAIANTGVLGENLHAGLKNTRVLVRSQLLATRL